MTHESTMTADAGGSVPAGDFDGWLADVSTALRDGTGMDVPCGDCRGCCTSGHFVHVGADEQAALSRIPVEVRVPAPGRPAAGFVMGFDADGHCPMHVDTTCSIYPHRPRTCRGFDCRVLAAAGVLEEGPWAERINARVRAWRFDHASAESADRQAAIARAASFIRSNASLFPGGRVPSRPLDLAVLAIKVHDLFVGRRPRASAQDLATAVIDASRRFDRATGRDAPAG